MINLVKGGNVNLSKTAPTTSIYRVGLSWDVKQDSTVAHDFDLDTVAMLTDSNGKGLTIENVHFYNNIDGSGATSANHYTSMSYQESLAEAERLSANTFAVTTKDNMNGEGDGDDETLFVNGTKIGDNQKVIVAVNIYQADVRKQVFGMVKNAMCKVYDTNGDIILQYELGEDFAIETGVLVGEFYRHNGEVKFRATGTGFTGDLNQLITQHV